MKTYILKNSNFIIDAEIYNSDSFDKNDCIKINIKEKNKDTLTLVDSKFSQDSINIIAELVFIIEDQKTYIKELENILQKKEKNIEKNNNNDVSYKKNQHINLCNLGGLIEIMLWLENNYSNNYIGSPDIYVNNSKKKLLKLIKHELELIQEKVKQEKIQYKFLNN
jgi:hypothetical protein